MGVLCFYLFNWQQPSLLVALPGEGGLWEGFEWCLGAVSLGGHMGSMEKCTEAAVGIQASFAGRVEGMPGQY